MRARLFVLFCSLAFSSQSFACWDDDDTSWYDSCSDDNWADEWDSDGGGLDDVEVVGDTYWYIDELDDYEYIEDEPDDEWQDNDEDDSSLCDITGFNYFRKSYTIRTNDVLVKEKIPQGLVKQETKNSCVVTAMEYAARILTGTDIYGRFYFADIYQSKFGGDVQKFGVNSGNMNDFFSEVFDVSYISMLQSFYDAVDNGYCILSVIDDGYTAHEILIVGYTEDKDAFIGIDPSDGVTKKYSYYELKDFNYVVKGVK